MFKINTNFIPSPSQAYIVGGTVRDMLMGSTPKDIDIVTLGNPEKLALSIAAKIRGRVIELGKPEMKIFRIVSRKQTYDIAPANGQSIEDDLNSRDFTINAMAMPLDNKNGLGKIIDPHNGNADLRSQKIRMISSDNLKADPIRLLRAYRIGSQLDFSVSQNTDRTIKTESFRIQASAGERIKDELFKLFNTPRSHQYIKMMNTTGLLTAIFPELESLKGCSQNAYHEYDVFDHTLKAYGFLEQFLHRPGLKTVKIKNLKALLPSPDHYALLKYTILLHDIGKPSTQSVDAKDRIHFYNHEIIGADMCEKINRRLRLSNNEKNYMDFIIRHHLRPLSLFTAHTQKRLSDKAISRFFIRCDQWTKDLLIHTAADLYGKGINKSPHAFNEFINFLLSRYTDSYLPKKSAPPLINGNDLINEFGLTPSPMFSKILRHVDEERFSENISTRNEALILVKNFLNLL